jgi:hypothetical protein
MDFTKKAILALCLVGLLTVAARPKQDPGRKEIDAFNQRYFELHRKMDTTGMFALWADDGVDLMPRDAPLIGKKKIVAWVEDILAKMPGYKVTKQEMEFFTTST